MKDYEKILKRLEENDFESYLVGGFVRDKLMGREIHDADIATRARPKDIMKIFSDMKLIDIGKKFGTIKVIYNSKEYEITTFRGEAKYKDRRHPDEIVFSDKIEDDLKRRDFTINAMAERFGEIIDLYKGRDDLKLKVIKSVGDPFERIEEDYLRSMRAIRFATILNFSIDDDLKKAIKKEAEYINYIAKERISEEFNKILLSDIPSYGIRLLDECNLLGEILPEIKVMVGFNQKSSHHDLSLFDHTMKVLDNTPKNLKVRMAALFHDSGKPASMFIDENGEGRFFGHQDISAQIVKKRLRILKYPKNFIKDCEKLVAHHMDNTNTYTKKSVRKLLRKVGDDNIYDLFELQWADTAATVNPYIENIKNAKVLLKEIYAENLPTKKKDLAIDGRDIMNLGFKEGKIIGIILNDVYELVFNELLVNKKNEIIKYIKNNYIEVDRK
ncbi:HD domain-containing protein [Anaerococcus sp. AGMB00486]|uniref:HD domain-containing protein n=2 Tax=Anaerococcus TaxID=165779 RepID=A0ABX2NDJ3_9FIRM|nr:MULTISPECIES: HD domain-containing protein [Anaerococcus]MDY3006899.1 HD domain-containing protein [Anaerococcus porci]MSS77772.1 HD domain-containing protein [Anaerococcus porci]NVF12537.1 HD domain-containing protein [Anaerococcus faecalis]